jgi:hypothetical protein
MRLPLEWFDDARYSESKISYENIKMLTAGHFVYGKSKYHTSGTAKEGAQNWIWKPCKIIHYDPVEEIFQIEWIESDNSKSQALPIKSVRRFNLLFEGENLGNFTLRVDLASNVRTEYEANVNFHLMINELNINDIAPLPKGLTRGALKRICIPYEKTGRESLVIVSELYIMVEILYERT